MSVDVWLMLMFGSFERYVGCSVRLDRLEIRSCFGWMFGSFGHVFRFEFCFGSMVVPVGFVFRLYAAILLCEMVGAAGAGLGGEGGEGR